MDFFEGTTSLQRIRIRITIEIEMYIIMKSGGTPDYSIFHPFLQWISNCDSKTPKAEGDVYIYVVFGKPTGQTDRP